MNLPAAGSDAAPRPRTMTVPVTGMTCATCALGIEQFVSRLPGVTTAQVSLADETLVVHYDAACVDERSIIARVRALGFGVPTDEALGTESSEDTETSARAADVNEQKRLLLAGLLLTVPLAAFSMARDVGWVGFRHDLFAMLVPATIVQFWVGARFYAGAYRSLRAGVSNMDVLIALGSSVAYLGER